MVSTITICHLNKSPKNLLFLTQEDCAVLAKNYTQYSSETPLFLALYQTVTVCLSALMLKYMQVPPLFCTSPSAFQQ